MSSAAVRIRLAAKAENVAVVRQALTGLGDAYELDPDFLSDVRTAVTEACNNAVIHAYPESGEGLMEVEADAGDGSLVEVVVRDYGAGLQPANVPAAQQRSLGLGLPLIAALSRRFQIRGGAGRGLEVHMLFMPTEDVGGAQVAGLGEVEETVSVPAGLPRAAGMSIMPGPLVSAISGRVTAMLAARADFPLDRLADAVLVSDAIAAHAGAYMARDDVSLAIMDGDGSLDFRVGPLREGGANGLLSQLEVPGLGGSLERLVDSVRVEQGADALGVDYESAEGEYLALRIDKRTT
jgi:anti-sigma regulatory factor (Ser/Thr protein kinase)